MAAHEVVTVDGGCFPRMMEWDPQRTLRAGTAVCACATGEGRAETQILEALSEPGAWGRGRA